jgi:hypothetical protein
MPPGAPWKPAGSQTSSGRSQTAGKILDRPGASGAFWRVACARRVERSAMALYASTFSSAPMNSS